MDLVVRVECVGGRQDCGDGIEGGARWLAGKQYVFQHSLKT